MSLTKVSYSMINGAIANVLDYGADSTGVADSTSAFNAAIATNKKVFIPNGTYSVSNVALLDNTWIYGENMRSVFIEVRTSNTAAFRSASRFYLRIENMTIRPASGVTNAKGFNQVDNTNYTAWAQFSNIETWADLEISYSGFFIFTRWDSCKDGESGSIPGGQYHQAIKSVPPTTDQGNTTNMNEVIKCNFNNSNDPNGAVYLEWGNLWTFRDCDFEVLQAPAVYAKGIFGIEFDGCWFEGITGTYVIRAVNSSAPNVQGSPNVSVSNCFYNGSGSNSYFLSLDGASTGSVNNLVATSVAAGCKLTDTVILNSISGVTARSGPGAAGFVNATTVTTQSSLAIIGLTQIYSGVINGTTPTSTGINVNQGSGGGVIFLTFTFSNSTGNASASSLYMIRCGVNGDNYTATKIVGDAGGAGAGQDVVSFSVVASILYVAAAGAGDGSFGIIYTT
jgi:hypothetical protein